MFNKKALLSFALAGLMLSGALTTVVSAQGNSEINYEKGPDVYIHEERLDVSTHNLSKFNSSLEYYGDNGEIQKLPATLNSSIEESHALTYTHISDEDLSEFPRGSPERAVDASIWSTDTSGSAGSASVSDSKAAENVDAVTFSTSSQTSGDVSKFTASSNISITSDANKRVLFSAFNVDTLDSGATVEIRAVDPDGDYVAANVSSGASTDTDTVAATATGEGYVFQQKISELPVSGTGDGDIDEIDSVEVVVSDGDANLELVGFDLERKSTMDLGETMRDTDGDGDDEKTTFTEVESGGEMKITGLDTLPSIFDDAAIQGLGVFGVEYRASMVDAEDVSYDYSEADNYPGYASKLDSYQRVRVPTAIDLSHSNLELRTQQKFIGERYKAARIAEGTGDTDFGNISSWTDVSDSYTEMNETIVLDSTIQPGQSYVSNVMMVLQDDQVRDLKNTGGAGAPVSGGLGAKVWGAITAVIATLTGGWMKLRGN